MHVTSAGVLRGHQAEPRGHLPIPLELAIVAHGGHGRIGGDCTDADDRAQPPTPLVLPCVRFDACIARVEVHVQLRPVFGQIAQQFLELGR